jgi:hypothetical protein
VCHQRGAVANSRNAGSTASIGGSPRTAAEVRPVTALTAAGIGTPGR